MAQRAPCPLLRPLLKTLWAADGAAYTPRGSDRERLLPTGGMNLVFRLAGGPVRLFADEADAVGDTIGHAIVGGARARYYLRDVSPMVRSVGATLQPGASEVLFGVPADELAGRHTSLEDLWGPLAREARERIALAGSPARQLDVLEALLVARLGNGRPVRPAVAEAVALIGATADVRGAVARSGFSHRRFIALFRQGTGLAPKTYRRVLRFQAALGVMESAIALPPADVALAARYSDQSHFNRDFLEFSGISPGRYRSLAPSSANHVPITR